MARSDEETVDGIVSDEVATDEPTTDSAATTTSNDDPTGRLAGLFSLKAFLLSAVLIGVGVGVVGGARSRWWEPSAHLLGCLVPRSSSALWPASDGTSKRQSLAAVSSV